MQKKGISGVTIAILGLVMLILGILIWSSVARGGLGQVPPLVQRIESETGEIPCMKGPSITISPVTSIIPTQKEIQQLASISGKPVNKNITFKPSIISNCLENLTIAWVFNETSGQQTVINTECAAPYTAENCSIINHTYELRGLFDLWKALPVKVSAFGRRSGFYTQSNTTAFVNDPYFSISEPVVDMSDFSCVKLTTTIKTLGTNPNPSFSIIDDGISRDVEDSIISVSSKGLIYSMLYRAGKSIKEHTVKLSATQGYQTTPIVEASYTPASLVAKPEFAVLGVYDVFNVYKTDGTLMNSGLIPPTDYHEMHIDANDLNNDGISEFVIFLLMDMVNYRGGDIFVQTYPGLVKTKTANKLNPDQLIARWSAHAGLRSEDNLIWLSVAAGKKITDNSGATGNIVVIGDPGDLALYRYAAGRLDLINGGGDFSNADWWRDVDAYDIDGDGEDEIMAIRSVDYDDHHAGDMLIFKYADMARADTKSEFAAYPEEGKSHASSDPYWIDLYDKDWYAVTAGNMIKDKNYTVVVNLGNGEIDAWWFNKKTKNFEDHHYWQNWPSDVSWQDVDAADVNGDGVDELIFLYDKDGYHISVLPLGVIWSIDSYDKFKKAAIKTIDLSSEKYGYGSIAVSDIGCFL